VEGLRIIGAAPSLPPCAFMAYNRGRFNVLYNIRKHDLRPWMVRRFTRSVLRSMKQAGVAKVSVNSRVGHGKQCFVLGSACLHLPIYYSRLSSCTFAFTNRFIHTAELYLVTRVGRKITGRRASRGLVTVKRLYLIFSSTSKLCRWVPNRWL
jgi:hypothetical protein